MRVTIVGGGNIGTQFAVHCAEKGHEVVIYTSTPECYNGHLCIVDEAGRITHEANICKATNDPEIAFIKAEAIFVTTPATMMQTVADMIFSYTDSDTMIGVVPGGGGSECAFRRCIDRGNVFFGIERVPAIARLIMKGKTVRSTGYRDELHVAAIPNKYVEKCAILIESIFDIRCVIIPCYLSLTLTPSNPILHTTRLRTLFQDWSEGIYYDYVPLFYEEWDDASSELLFACDEEVQEICHALPQFNLESVKSLRRHYESYTYREMTLKIASIPAFKGLKTPTIEINGRFIPDLHSRYFTSDFSYGLVIIRQVADFAGINTPNISETIKWYKGIALEKREFSYQDYGITNQNEFEMFYSQ